VENDCNQVETMREGPGSPRRWPTLVAAAGVGIVVLVVGAVPASAAPRSGGPSLITSTSTHSHSSPPRSSAPAHTKYPNPHPLALQPGRRPVLTFVSSDREVTLKIPTPPCPAMLPTCRWMLFVNEPDVPAQTVVGSATGTSGTLSVAYPTNFCGVIQADVYLGPVPWHLRFGHQRTIDTAQSCNPPPVPPNPQAVPSTVTSGTVPSPATPAPAAGATAAPQPVTPAGASQLAFTGANVAPLAIAGSVLLLAGIYVLTSLEQRRRALRRATKAMTPESVGAAAVKTSNWFIGE